jgi:putative flippase GtrA
MASFIGGIVNVAIGAIVLQAVYLTTIHNANQTGWSTSEVSNHILNDMINFRACGQC